MAGGKCAARSAHELDEGVSRVFGGCLGARLIGAASAVHFSGGNPGDPDMWTFGAPDRTIAVPDMGRRAGEGLARGDDRSG